MEQFAEYSHAILSVVIVALVAQILNAATGIRKGGLNMQPGAHHEADYDNPAYRLDRTYMNTVETLVFYAAIVFAAVLAGANPFWTNVLASAAMVIRVIANVIYLRGIGKGYGGIRTVFLVLFSLCNIVLVLLTIAAAL